MLSGFLLTSTTNNQNVLRFEEEANASTMSMNSRKSEGDTTLNRGQSIGQMICDCSILCNSNALMHVLRFTADTNRLFAT